LIQSIRKFFDATLHLIFYFHNCVPLYVVCRMVIVTIFLVFYLFVCQFELL